MLIGETKEIFKTSQWGFTVKRTVKGYELYSWDDGRPEEYWNTFETLKQAEDEAEKYW